MQQAEDDEDYYKCDVIQAKIDAEQDELNKA